MKAKPLVFAASYEDARHQAYRDGYHSSEFTYVYRSDQLMGHAHGAVLYTLGYWSDNPNHKSILAEAQARGMEIKTLLPRKELHV